MTRRPFPSWFTVRLFLMTLARRELFDRRERDGQ